MQRQKQSHYQSLIAAATGAPDHLLPLLETLMREEVFHSTLDWQSARQLADGARQAYDLYRSAPAYYDMDLILQKSRFQLARIEASLANAMASGIQAKITDLEIRAGLAREAVRRANEALPRLAEFYTHS